MYFPPISFCFCELLHSPKENILKYLHLLPYHALKTASKMLKSVFYFEHGWVSTALLLVSHVAAWKCLTRPVCLQRLWSQSQAGVSGASLPFLWSVLPLMSSLCTSKNMSLSYFMNHIIFHTRVYLWTFHKSLIILMLHFGITKNVYFMANSHFLVYIFAFSSF